MFKKSTSFTIFIIAITVFALVFLAATLLSYFHADMLYAMFLAFILFIVMSCTTVGIYSGLKFNSDDSKLKLYNKIGLIGNIVIFSAIVLIMFFALF